MHKNLHDSENDFSTGITSKKLEDRKTVLRGPSSRSWSHARAATWKDKSQLNIQLFTDGYEVKYHQHCHHVIMFMLTLSNNTKGLQHYDTITITITYTNNTITTFVSSRRFLMWSLGRSWSESLEF